MFSACLDTTCLWPVCSLCTWGHVWCLCTWSPSVWAPSLLKICNPTRIASSVDLALCGLIRQELVQVTYRILTGDHKCLCAWTIFKLQKGPMFDLMVWRTEWCGNIRFSMQLTNLLLSSSVVTSWVLDMLFYDSCSYVSCLRLSRKRMWKKWDLELLQHQCGLSLFSNCLIVASVPSSLDLDLLERIVSIVAEQFPGPPDNRK